MNAIEAALAKPDNTEFAIAMSDLVFARHNAVGFAAMSQAEQTAYCVDCLEREVNNGGFDQFFANSSGDTSLGDHHGPRAHPRASHGGSCPTRDRSIPGWSALA
jgi:hypothetical protein